MHKSAPFILVLIVSLIVAGILCCCATDMVAAQPELPPCHQQAGHQEQAPKDDCECAQIQSLAVVPSFDIAKPGNAQFDTIDIFSSLNSSISQQSNLRLVLATSLERSDSPPPLYLELSNLRL